MSRLWEIVEDRKPGVLESMGLQRVRHDLATEQKNNHNVFLHKNYTEAGLI